MRRLHKGVPARRSRGPRAAREGARRHRGKRGGWTRREGGPAQGREGLPRGPEARSRPGQWAGGAERVPGAELTVIRGMLFLPWKDILLLRLRRRLLWPARPGSGVAVLGVPGGGRTS